MHQCRWRKWRVLEMMKNIDKTKQCRTVESGGPSVNPQNERLFRHISEYSTRLCDKLRNANILHSVHFLSHKPISRGRFSAVLQIFLSATGCGWQNSKEPQLEPRKWGGKWYHETGVRLDPFSNPDLIEEERSLLSQYCDCVRSPRRISSTVSTFSTSLPTVSHQATARQPSPSPAPSIARVDQDSSRGWRSAAAAAGGRYRQATGGKHDRGRRRSSVY